MTAQDLQRGIAEAPTVSLAITAYNPERWLARALDSVLEQRTVFPIEIVIGDDCSTDGTLAIARDYRDRHPQIVYVIERPQNVGIQRNYYDLFEQCRGKYIAWLDADDFWTDREKLGFQVRALESDPSISVCCQFVRWVTDERNISRERYLTVVAGRYGIEEILRHNIVASPSAVFRNGLQRELPAWYFRFGAYDGLAPLGAGGAQRRHSAP